MLSSNIRFLVISKIQIRVLSTSVPGREKERLKDLSQGAKSSTVDHSEVSFHEKLKLQWWNKDGVMKGLHSLNKLRVPLVRDGLLNTAPGLDLQRNTPYPLSGTKILEVGCGGGIFTEPLGRLGAHVVGLDASDLLLSMAKDHALNITNVEYVNESIEDFCVKNSEKFDAAVASEVIEHVKDKDLFVESCIKTIKPGGSIFVTTLNKTNLSWLGGIMLAENVLKIVPPGTHHWDKFISPIDMTRLLEKYNCRTKLVHGMLYNFINNQWYWTKNTSINYAIHAIKNE